MKGIKKIIFLSLLVSTGLALSLVEMMMPVPFIAPGAKLGLANVVILVTLVVFGFKEALTVGILKSIILVLVTGSVTSFFYSVTGSIFSSTIMFIVYNYFSKIFSLIGVSIFGAIAHNFGQLLVASLMMSNFRMFYYYPILLLTGLFTGYFVGLASRYVSRNLLKSYRSIIDAGGKI